MLVNTKSVVIQYGVKINTQQCTTCLSRTNPTRHEINSASFKVNDVTEYQASAADLILHWERELTEPEVGISKRASN